MSYRKWDEISMFPKDVQYCPWSSHNGPLKLGQPVEWKPAFKSPEAVQRVECIAIWTNKIQNILDVIFIHPLRPKGFGSLSVH